MRSLRIRPLYSYTGAQKNEKRGFRTPEGPGPIAPLWERILSAICYVKRGFRTPEGPGPIAPLGERILSAICYAYRIMKREGSALSPGQLLRSGSVYFPPFVTFWEQPFIRPLYPYTCDLSEHTRLHRITLLAWSVPVFIECIRVQRIFISYTFGKPGRVHEATDTN